MRNAKNVPIMRLASERIPATELLGEGAPDWLFYHLFEDDFPRPSQGLLETYPESYKGYIFFNGDFKKLTTEYCKLVSKGVKTREIFVDYGIIFDIDGKWWHFGYSYGGFRKRRFEPFIPVNSPIDGNIEKSIVVLRPGVLRSFLSLFQKTP